MTVLPMLVNFVELIEGICQLEFLYVDIEQSVQLFPIHILLSPLFFLMATFDIFLALHR